MAAHASFTVADNGAVNHVFTRVGQDGSTVTFEERNASTPPSFWGRLVAQIRGPVRGSSVYRAKMTYTMPIGVTETINGVSVPKVERTFHANVEYLIPEGALESERDLFDSLVAGALANATIKDQQAKLLSLTGP